MSAVPPLGGVARVQPPESAASAMATRPDRWERLYARFTPVLRGVARSNRLSASDVDDAVQTAWLSLLDNIGRVRDPAAVGAWLTITTRRACLRLLRGTTRERPSDDPALGDGAERRAPADPEQILLATERRAIPGRALARCPSASAS